MAARADYRIIRDPPFVIRVGGDIDRGFDFTLPAHALLGAKSLLEFSVECELASSDDVALLYTRLNDDLIIDGFGHRDRLSVRHVRPANLLKLGSRANRLRFRIETILGRGRLRILSVVLWHKVDGDA